MAAFIRYYFEANHTTSRTNSMPGEALRTFYCDPVPSLHGRSSGGRYHHHHHHHHHRYHHHHHHQPSADFAGLSWGLAARRRRFGVEQHGPWLGVEMADAATPHPPKIRGMWYMISRVWRCNRRGEYEYLLVTLVEPDGFLLSSSKFASSWPHTSRLRFQRAISPFQVGKVSEDCQTLPLPHHHHTRVPVFRGGLKDQGCTR